MAKVFVSYSRKDIEFAKRLTAELQKSDLDFWIDWEGIPPTVDWWKEIQKGIEEADVFLFLISPDSARSKVCGQEIDWAVKNGKRLIPVVARDIQAEEVPAQLGHLNWIFLRDQDDFDAALAKLLTGIHTDYEWVKTHRRLQVKALEWERINKDSGFLLRGKDLEDAELQLATNTSKEPYPTDLQREYVFASRRVTDQQRRRTNSIAIGVAIVTLGLAIFGFYQASVSRTAQANAETQRNIALSRQWAAEAEAILANPAGNIDTATLLSLRALQTSYTAEADAVLLESLARTRSIQTFAAGDGATWCAFSSDGTRIMIGSSDATIRVLDAQTGDELQKTNLYSAGNTSVSGSFSYADQVVFSADGRLVLIGNGTASEVLLSDLATGKELQVFALHVPNEWVNSVALSPDNKYILTGNTDGTARLWAVGNDTPLHTFGKSVPYTDNAKEWEAGWITSVAFSPDGKKIVTGDQRGIVRVWEVASGLEIHVLQGHNRAITRAIFSPDGRSILAASEDRSASLWNAESGQRLYLFTGHSQSVSSVAFSVDGKTIATGSADGTVRLWDAETKEQLGTYTGHTAAIDSICFSSGDETMITGSSDTTARLWELSAPLSQPRTFSGIESPILSAAWSSDAKRLLTGSEDHVARLWDMETRDLLLELRGHLGPVTSVAFSPDGTTLVTGSEDQTAIVWNTKTGDLLLTLEGHSDWITSVQISPDGKKVLTGSNDGTAQLWDIATGDPLMTYGEVTEMQTLGDRYNGSVTDVAFSPDGDQVLTASFGNSVFVWDTDSGERLVEYATCMASSAVYAPDGKTMLVGCNDSETGAMLLDATARSQDRFVFDNELRRFTHPPAEITSVAFSPSGQLVLTGGTDNIARLWNLQTGIEIRSLIAHSDSITSVAFSPDGKLLLTSSADGTARLWDTDYHDTMEAACKVLTRDFTPEERTKYNIADLEPTCPNLPATPTPILL